MFKAIDRINSHFSKIYAMNKNKNVCQICKHEVVKDEEFSSRNLLCKDRIPFMVLEISIFKCTKCGQLFQIIEQNNIETLSKDEL